MASEGRRKGRMQIVTLFGGLRTPVLVFYLSHGASASFGGVGYDNSASYGRVSALRHSLFSVHTAGFLAELTRACAGTLEYARKVLKQIP